jgi:tetratricopeptide (TPR) repeat protein
VSPRARVTLIVAVAAAAAAGVTVAATSLTGEGEQKAAPRMRSGVPPLVLDLGVRMDPEARALRRASALYERRRLQRARAIFRRYDSVEAQVGAALSAWPNGYAALQRLAETHPDSAAARLALGLAEFWLRRTATATSAWRRAKLTQPDSLYAVRAADLLHPEDPVPGLPVFVPGFPEPRGLGRLSPPRQLALLRRRAAGGPSHDKLLYGVALQRLGRQLSAEREFRAAAELAPNDPEALTAAAVALFDKDRPSRAFSQLGPLARRYPKAATVRFHLGLMLLWLGRVDAAKRELRLAKTAQPGSVAARQAAAFLARLSSG